MPYGLGMRRQTDEVKSGTPAGRLALQKRAALIPPENATPGRYWNVGMFGLHAARPFAEGCAVSALKTAAI